jgi:hypothetical protein
VGAAGLVALLAAATALFALGVFLVRIGGDYQILSGLKRRSPDQIAVADLVAQYEGFSTGIFKFRFLNLVRAKGLLSRSGDVVMLEEFAADIEFDRHRRVHAKDAGRLLKFWKMLEFSTGYRLERRDEIYILLEDLVRAASGSQAAPQALTDGSSNLDLASGDQRN